MKVIRKPTKKYQTLEERMDNLILGSDQRQGNVFKQPPSRQFESMQRKLNQGK